MKLGKLYVCALAGFMGLGFSSCSDDNNGGTANPGTDVDYIGKAVGNFSKDEVNSVLPIMFRQVAMKTKLLLRSNWDSSVYLIRARLFLSAISTAILHLSTDLVLRR